MRILKVGAVGMLIVLAPLRAEVSLPGTSGARLGQGYDSVTGELRGTCVQPEGEEEQVAMNAVTIRINHVRDASQLAEMAEVGLSFNYSSGAARGNGSLSWFQRKQLSSFVETFYARGVYLRDAVSRRYSLKRSAKRLFERNWIQFRAQCGDRFVSSYTTGGVIEGTISIATSSTVEQNSLRASLGYSAPGGAVDANVLKTVLSSRDQFSHQASGLTAGIAVPFPGNGKDLIDQVLNVQQLANSNPAQNSRTSFATSDYATLIVSPDPDFAVRLAAMMKLSEDLSTVERDKADLLYLSQAPGQFGPFVEATRISELTRVNALQASLWTEARPCILARDMGNCRHVLSAPPISGLRLRRVEVLNPDPRNPGWQTVCLPRTGEYARVRGLGGWWVSEIHWDSQYYRPIDLPAANKLKIGVTETDLSSTREAGPGQEVNYMIVDPAPGDNRAGDPFQIRCEFLPFANDRGSV